MKVMPPILVVDDDHRMVKTLVDLMTVKGFQAEPAYDAQEALEKIRAKPYACLLSDVRMPGQDGVALYRQVRKHHPHMPVVLMTAYADDDLLAQSLKEGVMAVLDKPLNLGNFLSFLSFLRREQSLVLIDGSRAFCKTLEKILAGRGYHPVCLHRLEELKACFEQDVQTALFQLKLQDGQPEEVFRRIRQEVPCVPVVLAIDFNKEKSIWIEQARRYGIYAFIYRPAEMERLHKAITRIRRSIMGNLLENGKCQE
ncbi:MAG: response regulator [Anaerolineae bacterium]|nr:response regulator [Anaerolineae bacterium]